MDWYTVSYHLDRETIFLLRLLLVAQIEWQLFAKKQGF
ncbi:hypothetical protein FHW89_004487 [Mucilaginibacter sp. SG564]|nr:hypothetical protein [Mucilaginibacter sp. SG564]